MVVGLVQLADVVVVQPFGLRVCPRSLAQPLAEDVGRRLEVDDEIRYGEVGDEQLVEPLVDEELVVVQILVRVYLVPLEQVVGDRQLAEEIGLPQRRLLAVARQCEKELGLESGARSPALRVGEERVVEVVEYDRRVEALAQAVGESRLANADRSLDRDVAEIQGRAKYTSAAVRRNGRADCDSIERVRIDRIELRLLGLPLVRFFETSFGRVHERSFVLVRVEGEGEQGLGECVADADPYYSAETNRTAWHVLAEFLAPLVLGRTFDHPREVFDALRIVRGHNMAKAALEMAAWDLYARQRGEPLASVLGGNRSRIESGVSIGIQDSLDELVERVEIERAAGYRRVKIKIKPGWDVEAVARIRDACGDIPLMVDANAAYNLADAGHLASLDRFGLMMIEQPLEYDDVRDHACLQAQLETPICLDESIHSVRVAEEALDLGACRIVNVKPGRIGGHGQSIRLHDLCRSRGVPVWHGGMLESGIGRAHNIHLSTLPNFTLPGDVAASRRYYAPDLIDPEIEVASDGTIAVPTGPGIGVHVVDERVQQATREKTELRG